MASKRTWIWIGAGVAGAAVLVLVCVAAAGLYFVSRRVQTASATPDEAVRTLDAVVSAFAGTTALYRLDAHQKPQLAAPFADFPTSRTKATDLYINAWNPDEGRLVQLSLPLWLVRFGDKKMHMTGGEGGVNIAEFSFDVHELERIGPALVLDYRSQDGERILLWTK
jgi:hypothetical protein